MQAVREAQVVSIVDIAENAGQCDMRGLQLGKGIGKCMFARPAHVLEGPLHTRAAPHPDQPIAAVASRAEHRADAPEQPKRRRNMTCPDCWDIGADDDDRARRWVSHDALHASTEIAAPLRLALD